MSITIEEKKPKKVPGLTSLFVSFDYKPSIVEAIKKLEGCVYDKKTHVWEMPKLNLAKFLDLVARQEDVTLKLLKDKKEQVTDTKLSSYKTVPFEHQVEAVKYGLSNPLFLLNDEPGLGKSGSMIYLAQELKHREGLEHCLIVCGINSLKRNWVKEIHKHSDLDSIIIGQRVNTKGKIVDISVKERVEQLKHKIQEFFVIINIESLRDDNIIKAILKGPNKYDMIVADEVHKFKNSQAQQTKNFIKLNKSNHRIGLTGTLLTNNLLDCYSPLTWLGAEHSAFSNFKYYYCTFDDKFNNILVGFKNTDLLKEQLDLFSLRRTKDQLKDKKMPDKVIIHELVEMDTKQAEFYDQVKRGIRDQVDKVKLTSANILALTARLRQATALPSILTTNDIPSAKLDRCCELVDEIVSNGDKVLILSVFKDPVYELEKRLAQYKPLVGTGDIPDSVVSNNNELFQTDPSYKVFIGTHQKCGTGLTFDAASYAIILDELWTPADNRQSEDRIHRLTSTKRVFIYYLVTKDTIDEHVDQVVNDKGLVIDYLVDGKIPKGCYEKLRELIIDL